MNLIEGNLEQWRVIDLLKLALHKNLLLQDTDGHEFVVAQVDNFPQEVELLGHSDKFMDFLATRSKEKERYSLQEVKKRLTLE
jgi:hypothetical protein